MQEENSWIMLFLSCILVTLKLAAGRQTCRPAHAELGLKDWAIGIQRSIDDMYICTQNAAQHNWSTS
jgi:hypothetical protein